MTTKIYDLQLNESVIEGDFTITRVPGGWLYLHNKNHKIPAFVPFNNEFENRKAVYDLR